MIRFVIRRKMLDRNSGLASEGLETVDCECPELERVLMGGGTGQEQYDYRELAGAEVLANAELQYTEHQIAGACIAAEISDGHYESLLIALKA